MACQARKGGFVISDWHDDGQAADELDRLVFERDLMEFKLETYDDTTPTRRILGIRLGEDGDDDPEV